MEGGVYNRLCGIQKLGAIARHGHGSSQGAIGAPFPIDPLGPNPYSAGHFA